MTYLQPNKTGQDSPKKTTTENAAISQVKQNIIQQKQPKRGFSKVKEHSYNLLADYFCGNNRHLGHFKDVLFNN